MNIVKCKNNHFYDSDIYPSCPHCQPMAGNYDAPAQARETEAPTTAALNAAMGSDAVTAPMSEADKPTMRRTPADADDSKTISILNYDQLEGTDQPTVGWLVCVKGRYEGRDFSIKSGCNFIGRDADMDVCLAGELTVARRRHGSIVYEPRQNIFLVTPGESRELFYLNGKVVLEPQKMEKNDVIQIGTISLMLIPCCDDKFTWKTQEEE